MDSAMTPKPPARHEHTVAWVAISAASLRRRSVSSFCGAQPLRRRVYRSAKPTFLNISSISETSNTDDYAQFADMLDKGASSGAPSASDSNSPTLKGALEESEDVNVESEKYAEFSELLGLENRQHKSDHGRQNIAEATPRKVVIDPGDYDLFDSLLQQTGGTGRKPMKGSKKYVLRPVSTPAVRSDSTKIHDDGLGDRSEDGFAPSQETRSAPHLSDEETAQAYAIMMEEFGAGIHGSAVELPTDSDEVDVEPDKPKLLTPPTRPGDTARHQSRVELPKTLYDDIDTNGPADRTARAPPTPPELKAKPIAPAPILSSMTGPENIVEKADTFFEESGDVPPAEPHDEPLPVPELKPKPATRTESVIRTSSETSSARLLNEGMRVRENLEGPPGDSAMPTVDTQRMPVQQLRKPPARRTTGNMAKKHTSQIVGREATSKTSKKFAEVEPEVLQDPKLLCDGE